MGKSEKRELASRMAVLLAHLLKWSSQPKSRTKSWRAVVVQRKRIALALKETPSLKAVIRDRDWREGVWLDAVAQASKEAGLADTDLPEICPWTMEEPADEGFWPSKEKFLGYSPGTRQKDNRGNCFVASMRRAHNWSAKSKACRGE